MAEALEPIDNRLNELVDRAIEFRATAREACSAKAHLIRREMKTGFVTDGVIEVNELQPASRLTWSLLEDLLGKAA